MKYYFLETDERNKIPYAINKNRAFDIRHVTKEGLAQFPRWNMTEMIFPQEGFFPDILCRPCLLLSETYIDVLMMYEVDDSHRGIYPLSFYEFYAAYDGDYDDAWEEYMVYGGFPQVCSFSWKGRKQSI